MLLLLSQVFVNKGVTTKYMRNPRYRLLADRTLPGRDPLAAVPAFPAADDFAAPGRSCVHNPEMPAAALAALQSTDMVGRLLVLARHACLLR